MLPVLAKIVMAGLVCWSLLHPVAMADDLNHRKDQVQKQITQTRKDLNESTKELSDAAVALQRAEDQLQLATDELDKTKLALAKATKRDADLARKLKQARADLAKAKEAAAAGQVELAAEKKQVGEVVRFRYQQQSNLLPVAVLATSGSTADLQNRIQWSTTVFDTTQAQMDRLTRAQRKLDDARALQATLEQQVDTARLQAARDLQGTQQLQEKAKQQAASVAALVTQRSTAKLAAQNEVKADKARYAKLTTERAAVEKRIEDRITEAKARARAEKKAAGRKANQSPPDAGDGRDTSHGFIYPVTAPITSPYGMRLHPVLGYWKLHDGTDFGAGCGTPIRAAYAGRVSEKYYNPGYGNRLMIDHGEVDGRYVTTGYNHAIRYSVDVGDRVQKGQVIGYIGATGYVTGCHLHLMVWLDGKITNPMAWY